MPKFNQNEHPISGTPDRSTAALLFNLDLKIKCIGTFSPVLVVDIQKGIAFLVLFQDYFFLPYSNTDNSWESRDHIIVTTLLTAFCVWIKSLHLTKL